MRKYLILMAALVSLSVSAQTSSLQTQFVTLAQTAWHDAQALSFTNGFDTGTFGLYKSKEQFAVGEELSTANTNGFNLGVIIADVHQNGGNSFAEGTFNLSLTGTEQLPFLGTCQLVAETGAVKDLTSGGIWNETSVLVKKTFSADHGNILLNIGGGECYFQEWSTTAPLGFISITDFLQGKHLFGLY